MPLSVDQRNRLPCRIVLTGEITQLPRQSFDRARSPFANPLYHRFLACHVLCLFIRAVSGLRIRHVLQHRPAINPALGDVQKCLQPVIKQREFSAERPSLLIKFSHVDVAFPLGEAA